MSRSVAPLLERHRMKLFDRIMAKITGRSATSESGQSYQQSERSLTALSKFEKTILSWDREQARIALAVLATGHGDRGPIESIFGKRATVRNAIQRRPRSVCEPKTRDKALTNPQPPADA